ncbi:MAG: ribulokinase, partial [Anaerolineae bacterium]
MSKKKYTIGVDYGTESGRAVLVDVATGEEVATAVHPYGDGVIDEHLPGSDKPLPPDFALQNPQDYIKVLKETIPAVLRESGVDAEDVIGIGTDFTACTMLPIDEAGTPLCMNPELRDNPYAWVKIWKHHAAQPEANQLNEIARQRDEAWLGLYGGKISSEWLFPKIWET